MMKIIMLVALFVFLVGCTSVNNSEVGSDYVKIPVPELSDKIQFYEYNANGVEVRYFAVLGSDGEPRIAFDACDVCGGYRGYTQVGTDIKCNNCGRVFDIDGLGTENKGYGCWPSYLPKDIEGRNIIIKTSDLEGSAHRFR